LSSHSAVLSLGVVNNVNRRLDTAKGIIFAPAKPVLVLRARTMRWLQSSRRLSISTWMLSPGVQRWPAPEA